mmetsp:Transcript_20749/g.30658  ORF Transcript_20749/g.30658 Transcript_20749/m.30658 type:complete len:221 (+) Transcript_20749:656-1318(+)
MGDSTASDTLSDASVVTGSTSVGANASSVSSFAMSPTGSVFISSFSISSSTSFDMGTISSLGSVSSITSTCSDIASGVSSADSISSSTESLSSGTSSSKEGALISTTGSSTTSSATFSSGALFVSIFCILPKVSLVHSTSTFVNTFPFFSSSVASSVAIFASWTTFKISGSTSSVSSLPSSVLSFFVNIDFNCLKGTTKINFNIYIRMAFNLPNVAPHTF